VVVAPACAGASARLTGLGAGSRDRSPERWQRLAREILQELIEINTTHSTGSATEAAEGMRRRH
jgi:hypothetical protein